MSISAIRKEGCSVELTALLGLLTGVALLLWAIMSRGALTTFWDPSALLIVLGGTLAAVAVSHGKQRLMKIPSAVVRVFREDRVSPMQVRERLVQLARKARREGLLALEDDLEDIEDSFMRRAVQMLIDATPSEQLQQILEAQVRSSREAEGHSEAVFRTAGTLSPAFGMIGTLIGLIEMLRDLDDPSGVGTGMAVALITTLYGTLFANLLFVPLANKLEEMREDRVKVRHMIITGVLAIQEGQNPRFIASQIDAYLQVSTESSSEEEERAQDIEDVGVSGQEVASDD